MVSRRDVPGKPGKDLGISMEPSVLVSHVKSRLEDIQASLEIGNHGPLMCFDKETYYIKKFLSASNFASMFNVPPYILY